MIEPIPPETERVASVVLDGAFRVHSRLGPGLVEEVYEACLCYEISKAGLRFERQKAIPVIYESVRVDAGLRLDVLVEDAVILELKSVREILPLHRAQVLTYLKLSGKRLGLLMNFNVPHPKDGIERFVL
jgi:GxxExxY protein